MKSIQIIQTTLAGIIILFLTSCEGIFYDCITGNGTVESETRAHADFKEIYSTGPFDVYIQKDSLYSFKIEAEGNLIGFIESYVSGDRLVIETEQHICLRNYRPMKIFISTPSLEEIKNTGSGNIEADYFAADDFNVKMTGSGTIYFETTASKVFIEHTGSGDIEGDIVADFLDTELTGSGDIELAGTAKQTDLKITGSGKIEAFDLAQQECEASIMGSGNIYTWVSDFLDAFISGSGDIFYKGTPR